MLRWLLFGNCRRWRRCKPRVQFTPNTGHCVANGSVGTATDSEVGGAGGAHPTAWPFRTIMRSKLDNRRHRIEFPSACGDVHLWKGLRQASGQILNAAALRRVV